MHTQAPIPLIMRPSRPRPRGSSPYSLSILLACACGSPYSPATTTTDANDSSSSGTGTGTTETPASTSTDATATSTATTSPTTTATTGPTSSTDPGTTAETSTTGPSTTTEPPVCGDGVVEGDEACDDGNDDNTDACTDTCDQAACGDGFLQAGVEECDDGNDDDADACLGTCVVAACGDGVVWAGEEACDDGEDNGTYGHCLADCSGLGPSCGDGERNGPEECDDANQTDDDDCSNDCVAPRVVFVTGQLYNGDLGGLAGADAKCAASALTGLLSGDVEWLAWLSDGTTSPTSPGRMDTTFTGYYKLTTGEVFAHGWTDIVDGMHDKPIGISQNQVPPPAPLAAWSNTTADGASFGAEHCDGWTSPDLDVDGRFGDVSASDAAWTDAEVSNPIPCVSSFHLYCFQNTPLP